MSATARPQPDPRPAEPHLADDARCDALLGRRLLRIARTAIAERLGRPAPPPADLDPSRPSAEAAMEATVEAAVESRLQAAGASFVTLTVADDLRGCIGTLEAWRPLADDVAANAQAAAFSDYRFSPVTARELPSLRVEVSVLGTAEPLAAASEAEAIARLVPGRDGLILATDGRRATFLPQVWETLPDPRDFLAHLKRKAGLPADRWPASLALWRYTVRKWKETS